MKQSHIVSLLQRWRQGIARKKRSLVAIVVAALAGIALHTTLGAAPDCTAPGWDGIAASPARGRVVAVIDGDTVELASGLEVRLVGIQAPKLPLGRPGFEAWPLADEARAALRQLVEGRQVGLRYGGNDRDRHGRALAHLYLSGDEAGDEAGDEESAEESATWVQGALLERGLARVYTFRDNRACIPDLLAAERRARAAAVGIWDHPFYAVRSVAEVEKSPHLTDSFQLVEGRVVGAARLRDRVFLNFGADYRTDFTVTIEAAGLKIFDQEGREPTAYQGRRIRVRGWMREWNGPLIEVTHPEQIEELEP